ncbi:arginine--tRNA ligase [Thorsellia anophelis]|uniref:Arginine--tRNA ligase n=1 Tax=Thorsellia anophelis DSM 18579 TaxID=1123402 RepID=A0A1H9ZED2_9GAMM|nr:arginine--tRNA ligase [Thorsellia anophelis]SES79938.1 arginyl-tRNA synthetase [Thorsellia anophelis DSM 18579]
MNIQVILTQHAQDAFKILTGIDNWDPQVKVSAKAQFGDYQINGIMSVAKKVGQNPRELASQLTEQLKLDASEILFNVEVAGPGFINLTLSPNWLASQLNIVANDSKLGLTPVVPQTVVVDYSAPNVAKEMHVGHLRTTIIGDAVVRTLELLGHNVIRANHIGDWGTQFGMLIAYLEKMQNEHATDMALTDLEAFYRDAKKTYDEDEEFALRARGYVVKLQGGDEYCLTMWQKLVKLTMAQNFAAYERLNVTLTEKDTMGESLYNSMLPNIVADLKAKGIAVENEGATVVFLSEYKNKNGDPMGVVVQKNDGGFLYTTTDIASVKYRVETLKANRVLYYVDSRQNQHLTQAWMIARMAGYAPESVSLEHHQIGMMLGKDSKPFKTRSGGTIKLVDLLDEAKDRAKALILSKNDSIDENELDTLAEVVGIGAVKYADLSKNRTTDYIFDWDNMLSFDGNTAPYMLYANARVQSIFKRFEIDPATLNASPITLQAPEEIALSICLLQFEEVITAVAREGAPHIMCTYLYELAGAFSRFYEAVSIMQTEEIELRNSRLLLASLTSKTLKTGLTTLGIKTVERM